MYKVQYKLSTKKTSAYHHQSVKHQEEAVDEPLRTVVQTFIQALLMTIGGTPNSNTGSNNDAHDEIMDRQPASTLNATDNQGQSMPPQKDSYDTDPMGQIGKDPIINFKRTRQVIMGIDALLHTPELCNKILQELNWFPRNWFPKEHSQGITTLPAFWTWPSLTSLSSTVTT